MKKSVKIILIVVSVFLIAWLSAFFVDMHQVINCKLPIFAQKNGYMGSMTKYSGIGYIIGIEATMAAGSADATHAEMYMNLPTRLFDFKVASGDVIIDYVRPSDIR